MFRQKKTLYFGFALAICVIFGSSSLNAIINVPADRPTMQVGIDVAIPSDALADEKHSDQF